MTNSEMKTIYDTACRGKGYEPNDDQFKVWKQVLGWCESGDLAQGLIYWFSNNSTFPMPAELKPLSEQARRERTARSTKRNDFVAWKCPVCASGRSGWPDDPERTRFCMNWKTPSDTPERCGAKMQIAMRRPEDRGTMESRA